VIEQLKQVSWNDEENGRVALAIGSEWHDEPTSPAGSTSAASAGSLDEVSSALPVPSGPSVH
jgi:hypothetical protein